MENLAFELGFDLDVPAVQGVRDGVFPLQLALVNDDVDGSPPGPAVISPFDPLMISKGYFLSFRIYDFTDPDGPSEGDLPSLSALQVLFTSATPTNTEFSPFVIDDETQAQLATTCFLQDPTNSVAFGTGVRCGWEAQWSISNEIVTAFELMNCGRFNFRALLTVGVPGQVAKFYRTDPEMVIGDAGGGPERTVHSTPATARR